VPLYSELMAAGAGDNIKGVYGSMNWNWQLPDEGTQAFVKSFGEKYGRPPSNSAQTCYVQTLLYADAVARAGSFNPCAVVEALEGFEFDGMGNGPTTYRAEDHQCFKDVLVMKGAENPSDEYHNLEIVEITPVAQVMYPPDHPMFGGPEASLGECNAG
jgi:branched-chain amino acid transport system substrate-binding protein